MPKFTAFRCYSQPPTVNWGLVFTRFTKVSLRKNNLDVGHRPKTTFDKGALVTELPLLVRTRFQDLFHSPLRGSFRLSLTVLVHYRSAEST